MTPKNLPTSSELFKLANAVAEMEQLRENETKMAADLEALRARKGEVMNLIATIGEPMVVETHESVSGLEALFGPESETGYATEITAAQGPPAGAMAEPAKQPRRRAPAHISPKQARARFGLSVWAQPHGTSVFRQGHLAAMLAAMKNGKITRAAFDRVLVGTLSPKARKNVWALGVTYMKTLGFTQTENGQRVRNVLLSPVAVSRHGLSDLEVVTFEEGAPDLLL